MKIRRKHRPKKSASEQQLLASYWPGDYPIGSVHSVGGKAYVVTRIERIPQSRFFMVWGYEMQAEPSTVEWMLLPKRFVHMIRYPARYRYA
jgi:hypothetical protein